MHFPEQIYNELFHSNEEPTNQPGAAIVKPKKKVNIKEEPKKVEEPEEVEEEPEEVEEQLQEEEAAEDTV